MPQTSQDRVVGLWGTPFLYYAPDGHEAQLPSLLELATGAPERDLLTGPEDAARWLGARVGEAVAAFLSRLPDGDARPADITSRTLVFGHSDYQPLRNHPEYDLSGLFYIAVPNDVRDSHHRYDADSNALSFYDPRFAMNMGAIAKDPNIEMEKQVRPEPGVLVAWPSYVDYFMHPNLSGSKLVAIQFNAKRGALR